jgi:transglutaminase-like putative cysteine protease
MSGRARVAIYAGIATLAASSALSAVFQGFVWVWPIIGAVAMVVLVSELVRWSPIPSGLAPLLAAGMVTCYLVWIYAGDSAIGGIVPNGPAMRALGDTARSGFHDIRTLGTPVPGHRGLVLIATVGIAAVALVVDLLAVTMRRAALAGLPLLAVFALSTSVAKHGAGWVPFVIGTAGYLGLLLADSRERFSRWGRPLGFDRESRPRFTWSDQDVMPSPLSVMGRRIGLAAIGIGVVVPLLIPGLRGGVPHGSGNGLGLGGSGNRTAQTVNPIVTVGAELTSTASRNLLLVRTSDPSPGYLRLTALDRFDGTTFSPSTLQEPPQAEVSNGIQAPPTTGRQQTAQISVQDLATPWLPVPQQVEQVQVQGDWRYDPVSNTIFSARDNTQGKVYSVVSVTPQPTAAQLEQATTSAPGLSAFTALPGSISAGVRQLTARVTEKATTPFDKALAIQRFLTSSPFTYTLHPASGGPDPLGDFLLRTHAGFCQQYASAMAVMARLVGIPARVAVGFTRGDQQPDGTWLIKSGDAHAWPELYFSGYGWLPFEPTPRADGQAVQPSYTTQPVSQGKGKTSKPGSTSGAGGKSTPANPFAKNQHLDNSADANGGRTVPAAPAAAHHSHQTRATVGWVALGLALVALIAPSIARVVSRRRRWRQAQTPAERATAAWEELRASAIDTRAGWIDGLTPRATARVLRAEAPGLATAELRALDRVVDAVQRAWYSPNRAGLRADTLEDDVADIRAAMLAESSWRERFVLRTWPRSTLRTAAAGVGRLGELLDAVDLGAARLRARLRPRAAH